MRGKSGVVFLLLILSVILLTTGCWNRKELDRLAIVAAVGIDKGEDQKITLTVQVIKPEALKRPSSEGGSGKEKGVWIIKSSGNTIFDAVRNFVEKSGRKLFLPHTMVIVIGEKMAKDGVIPVIDWFLRDHEMRLQTWVLVAQGEASEVIKGDSGLEKIPASHLERMIEDYGALSKSVSSNLMEVTNMITCQSSHPVIGRISKNKSGQDDEEELILKGAGVFRKDRLIGWLNPFETRGYLWIKGKVKSGVITIPCPEHPDQLISLEIIKSKTKVKPRLEMGMLKYTIEVDVNSNLGEQMCTEDLANPEMIAVLEDEQRQAVEKEIVALIRKAQEEYKLDILGLGEATMREFPKEWNKVKEQWAEEFPQAEVEVKVNSRLSLTGMLKSLKTLK
ncbi:Spore germination protein GerKC [Desulfosporosinus sp. I2]|uniref:Ger(x)C family spore germination protein n=1 Tax=Desulfosporosinus sp. I2 TaxID=1617025 RepID=UPI0005EE0ECF|nr:Ger(x)C family spore germination protein [Desulfosporosinus sp. I2]KJR44526.1 Spore germination protein GerKC [Desulfosporosinus sp. I2]